MIDLSGKPLGREFFDRDTEIVAEQLLGTYLVREFEGILLGGMIIETEAYLGFSDEASHSFKGLTNRTAVIFGEAGHAYVYHIHRYHCMDIVTQKPGVPGSVLIRAVQPLAGIETMMRLRGKPNLTGLVYGPGKICQALAITRELNGVDVTIAYSAIRVLPGITAHQVVRSPRVGVSKAADKLLRFTIG